MICTFVHCGESEILSFRHFVTPPSQMEAFFGVSRTPRPTFELYLLRKVILPTASDIAHFIRSCGYNLDRNSLKANITSAGHITHEVNITHKVHITASKKPLKKWLCLQSQAPNSAMCFTDVGTMLFCCSHPKTRYLDVWQGSLCDCDRCVLGVREGARVTADAGRRQIARFFV